MEFPKKLNAVALILIVLGALPFASSAQRKKNIAVLDFEFSTADKGAVRSAYGDIKNLCRQVSARMEKNLVSLNSYTLVERREITKVLAEQDYGQAGRIDPDTAAKLHRILGVDALIIGSITQLEFEGLPKDVNDQYWAPELLKAKMALTFRVVDATTAQLQFAQEVIGLSSANHNTNQDDKGHAKEKAADAVKRGLGIWRDKKQELPSAEHYKKVINRAVEDAVIKVAQQLNQAETSARRPTTAPESAKTVIQGRVHLVKGQAVFVTGIDRSQIKLGDRLFVRRFHLDRDPNTGKEIRFSEKVGELEVTEIQDEVVVGTFSGAEMVKPGDAVTNK